MKFMVFVSAIVAAASAHEICIDPSIGHRACMTSEKYFLMDQAMYNCSKEVSKNSETMTNDEGKPIHKNDDFNFLDFVRGYSAQKVCVFETLKWLDMEGNILEDKVYEFMNGTRLTEAYSGESGKAIMQDCERELELIDVNSFFANMEPQNMVCVDEEFMPEDYDDSEDNELAHFDRGFNINAILRGRAPGLGDIRDGIKKLFRGYDESQEEENADEGTSDASCQIHVTIDQEEDVCKAIKRRDRRERMAGAFQAATEEEREELNKLREDAVEALEEAKEAAANYEEKKDKNMIVRMFARGKAKKAEKKAKDAADDVEKAENKLQKKYKDAIKDVREARKEKRRQKMVMNRGLDNGMCSQRHAMIHIPKQSANPDEREEEMEIDIVEEYCRLCPEEREESMLLLKPITFFRATKTHFDRACREFIDRKLVEEMDKIEIPQAAKVIDM